MKFIIKHEIKGRIRVHLSQRNMTFCQADLLLYYLESLDMVSRAKVYERTSDAVIYYTGDRNDIIRALQSFQYENAKALVNSPERDKLTGRELNADFKEKLIIKVLAHYGRKLFIPYSVRAVYTALKSLKYIKEGISSLIRRKIEVSVLDATAIGVSVIRGDMDTASSVMFLLSIGELLEEWTHKKSVDDLARSMSLNISRAWRIRGGKEELVPTGEIGNGDLVVVRVGNVIPFDGEVKTGDAMVNQASLTGESLPVHKGPDSFVHAGTVLEEGEITIEVKNEGGLSRYEKIVTMIEESEKLKSGLESKAEHLADRLVPYTLLGTGLTWLLTKNTTKALSVLMVDFSCALKLAMPIAVLSAIREASNHKITVKGGKFLEAVAEADTIVFDKTGTLTKATPTVVDVVSFCEESPDELLRIAACLEEHFPHSMAKAVVKAAHDKGLHHEEMHSKVEYIVAHGISTRINRKKAVIGSYHFVFEDEKCKVPREMEEKFRNLPKEYSHLYLAIQKKLVAVICIEDPLREEAADVIRQLKKTGQLKTVMMTGDSERTAAAIAGRVGVDEYYSEVLPEDKSGFVDKEKLKGRKVIMIGDGVNDSPALSASDAGIAISDGAEIAREIADITISADDLRQLVILKKISDRLMHRISRNYRIIVGFNTGLILLGVAGVLMPTTSALLHNASTLGISLMSMRNLIPVIEKDYQL